MEDILRINYLMQTFEPHQIEKILNSLKLDNMRIYLISNSFVSELDLEEPIYKTKYTFQKFDNEIEEKFHKPLINPKKSNKKLGLPVKNIFLPQNFEIITKDAEIYPKKIMETPQSIVYFKQDDKFKTPKASIYLRILSASEGFPINCSYFIFSKIWQDLFYNNLRESLYLAGFVFSFFKINNLDFQSINFKFNF